MKAFLLSLVAAGNLFATGNPVALTCSDPTGSLTTVSSQDNSAWASTKCEAEAVKIVKNTLSQHGATRTAFSKPRMFQDWRGLESWEIYSQNSHWGQFVHVVTLDANTCKSEQYLAYSVR